MQPDVMPRDISFKWSQQGNNRTEYAQKFETFQLHRVVKL